MNLHCKKAIRDRIKKNYFKLTNTEEYIAKKLIKEPSILEYKTLNLIAKKTNSSQGTLYRFLKKLGFNDIFSLKYWLIEKNLEDIPDYPLLADFSFTLSKLNLIETKAVLSLIKQYKQIFIIAKNNSKSLGISLKRKLIKLNLSATFVLPSDYFLYSKYSNCLWICISISGTSFSQKTYRHFDFPQSENRILFSAIAPPPEVASNFTYTFYGYTKRDFLPKEFAFPLDSELLCLLVINDFVGKLAQNLNG